MNILVTGANGFVGFALCQRLLSNTKSLPFQNLYGLVRNRSSQRQPYLPEPIQTIVLPSLEDLLQEGSFLSQIDCIVHLAARVHQTHDTATDPLAAFRAINTEATLRLATSAAQAGVKRFVYLSSVKVHGERNTAQTPFIETDNPMPEDPYGISKWEAEMKLRQLADQTGLELAIIRPPLVYGPGVKANFLQLLNLVQQGIPLPLGRVQNARSLVFVDNLADAITTCIHHPAAAGETFLISDGEDISTPDLIRSIAQAMDCPARLLQIPPAGLMLAGKLTGKMATVNRLLTSLTVNSQHIRQRLQWQPPYSLSEGIQRTVGWYKSLKQNH